MAQRMDEILKSEDQAIKEKIQRLNDTWVGRDVIHLHGKFSGRRARIRQVIIINNRLLILAQPYRLKRGRDILGSDDLIWDHPDARGFHPLHWFELVDD